MVRFLIPVLVVCLQLASAVEDTPILTPKEVIGWLAPLRIEDGRLGIDWANVGIASPRTAGLQQVGAGYKLAVDTDVKFNIALPGAAAAFGDVSLQLHIKGGSDSVAGNSEVPSVFRISENSAKGALRGELKTRGAPSQSHQAFDFSEINLNLDSITCLALYSMNRRTREFSLKFKEERALKFDLSISESKNILLIHFEELDASGSFDFVQRPGGEAELSFDNGAQKSLLRGTSFKQLLWKYTPEVQLNFVRVLADHGVQIALSQELPVVMAAATTGFSEPTADAVKRVDALITTIGTAEAAAERARAATELTRFFPQAILHLEKAAESEPVAGVKAVLQKSIAAHPGIARAKPYVLEHKLHEDQGYLFDIFRNCPLFKDAARARLALLIGKDYGDDPDNWSRK